jgi:hypothetical protein
VNQSEDEVLGTKKGTKMDEGGTSYIAPVKRETEKISSFVKTASYKTVVILGTLLP